MRREHREARRGLAARGPKVPGTAPGLVNRRHGGSRNAKKNSGVRKRARGEGKG